MTDQVSPPLVRGPGKVPITLQVNGVEQMVFVEPRRTLLDALRVDLGLTGTKLVCGQGNCGACTVHLDGEAVYSCLLLAVECEGAQITTIEGIAPAGELHPVQRAFVANDALQCGFCTPGQVMAATALLSRTPSPSDDEIVQGMSGNLCRCGAYRGIIRALKTAGSGQ
ncbi:MAG: (2Fe-2S)-binding protein [Chloroflexales bacterium]|nr:(2Fe-2S)-binding protein [Chloroflexales bacterium]